MDCRKPDTNKSATFLNCDGRSGEMRFPGQAVSVRMQPYHDPISETASGEDTGTCAVTYKVTENTRG